MTSRLEGRDTGKGSKIPVYLHQDSAPYKFLYYYYYYSYNYNYNYYNYYDLALRAIVHKDNIEVIFWEGIGSMCL